jgi:FkbM family methyltransferase
MRSRDVIKRAVQVLGYEVRRAPPDGGDAFSVQRALIGDDATVIFDVGANVGQTAARYRSLFPVARIHSFEPHAPSFERLAAYAASTSRVKAHRLALADVDADRTLHVNSHSETNSLLSSAPHADRYFDPALMAQVGSERVEGATLDTVCRDEQLPRIDILKVDVQGGELLVLKGAHDLLARGAIGLVYTEAMLAPVYERQADLFDIGALLVATGYRLFGLYDLRHGRNGMLVQADAIFIPERLEAELSIRR